MGPGGQHHNPGSSGHAGPGWQRQRCEKWPESGDILKIEPPGLADRLNAAKEESGVRTDAIMTTIDS